MQVTVALNKDQSKLAAAGKLVPSLETALNSIAGTTVVRVFGRGRSASIQTSAEGLAQLKHQFGDVFTFSKKLPAKPFGSIAD